MYSWGDFLSHPRDNHKWTLYIISYTIKLTMDIAKFKLKLKEEQQKLEEQLSQIGRRNPSNPDDWEPQFNERNEQHSAQDEMADKFEDMEQTLALQDTYEKRLAAVRDAIGRIENGTYGKCNCGKDIPEERLEADPAASCMCGSHN